jgi:ectoine hydroxylase-related dioxygenase (phytanoyl-CoA dioxygenase family)
LDPVKEASLRCVAGSHLWPKEVLPTRWLAETSFYPEPEKYMPVPDPDAEGMRVVEFEMEPGDAVAFNYLTLHGAPANKSKVDQRRAFSLRLMGDNVRFARREGINTSPPFRGVKLAHGAVMDAPEFPLLAS